MSDGSSRLRRWLVNGIVITVPLVVTVLLFAIVFDFLLGFISPVVRLVAYVWPTEPSTEVIELLTLVSILGLFVLVGMVAEYTPGRRLSSTMHATAESIPGVSTIYTTVRRASNLLVDDDTNQFQDVRLVEFPHGDSYMLAFLTADTSPVIRDAVNGNEMLTVMVPLGPNPTTNGFIMHVPTEDVHDVDVTVEEAVRSIATLGVASNDIDAEA